MQVSKSRMQKAYKAEMYHIFYQFFADLKNIKEAELFFNDFLTRTEKSALAKRLMIAVYLEQGKSYDYIKKTLKVSSATIASVEKQMKKNKTGFALAIKKIDADRWALNVTNKVDSFIKEIIGKK